MKLSPFLFLILFSVKIFSQPIVLDSTFGVNGVRITHVTSGYDEITSMAIQQDGKIVIAGTITIGTNFNFGVARYLTDGSLDSTFDFDGITDVDFDSSSYDMANGLAIQSDGKIVVVGLSKATNQKYNFALLRLNMDGSLDTTFDGDGKLLTSFGIQYDLLNAIVIQPDGKILVAGASGNQTGLYAFALARYFPDGSLDSSFSGDGMEIFPISFSTNIINSLVLQPDNKIVVAGNLDIVNNQFAIARFLPDGTIDSSFNSVGFLTKAFPPWDTDEASSIALQPDGKILVAGRSGDFNQPDRIAILRLLSDGTPDSSFNFHGYALRSWNYNAGISAIILQPNGKILVACTDTTMGLARFSTDGLLDYSVDPINMNGIYNPFIGRSGASCAAMQADGKIVLAGSLFNPNGNDLDFIVARYITNVTLNVDEKENLIEIKIYPNPTSSHISISLPEQIPVSVITITNIIGQELSNEKFYNQSSIEFDINGESGFYFVKIVSGGKSRVFKIVKL